MYNIYEELGGNRHFYKSTETVTQVLEIAEEYWSIPPRNCRLVVTLPGCYPERLEQAFQAALWKTGKVEAVDGDAFERTFRDAVTEAFAKDEKVSLEWVPATVRGER